MQITGTVKRIFDTSQVSDRFKKREFWLHLNDAEYPQTIVMQMTQDRCDRLDTVKVGESITAHFNLRGREWTSPQGEVKCFNTIECWKIDSVQDAPKDNHVDESMHGNDFDNTSQSSKDDLPF